MTAGQMRATIRTTIPSVTIDSECALILFALEVVHRNYVVPAGHDELVGGDGGGSGHRTPSSPGCRRGRRPVRRPPPGDVNVVDARDLSDGGDDGPAVPVVDAHDAAVRAAGHDEVLSLDME